MIVRLGAREREAIAAAVREAYPHEGCGFLLGESDVTEIRVAEVRAATNARDDSPHNRYMIEPEEFLRVLEDAETRGLDVVGFYHSHPDAPGVPSTFDRDHAWPHYAYLVVSVRDRMVGECRTWLLNEESREFEEVEWTDPARAARA
ncbi:MAG: M67 family metallopeptidase [Candidatus Rokuibacteriota bacterium]